MPFPSVTLAAESPVFVSECEKMVSLRTVRNSWILQLENQVLCSLIAHNAAHIHPSSTQINAINKATREWTGSRAFNHYLREAGIFLTANQAKWVNAENRQIHYRRLIENDVLREFAKDFHIQGSRWNFSVKKQISIVNAGLRRPITPASLYSLLARLKITVNHEQLAQIIDESKRRIKTSPYLSTYHDCNILEKSIDSLNIKTVKQQFSGYLSLIINETALSAYSIEELKNEICSIKNPFMSLVKSIRLQAEKLQERRNLLEQELNKVDSQELFRRIEKTINRLNSVGYALLFKQQSALEKWAMGCGMTDILHREISTLASNRVLHNAEANRLFEKLQQYSMKNSKFKLV